jgi:DNA-binding transcriptional regulator YiaG
MADSEFWRDLAVQFRALPDPRHGLSAIWWHIVGSALPSNWQILDLMTLNQPLSVQYSALAARAGARLNDPNAASLIDAWLERLKYEACAPITGGGHPVIEGVETHTESGTIERLCEASASLCSTLELQALEREHFLSTAPIAPVPEVSNAGHPTPSKAESLGQQIDRLREECHLSLEKLAEAVGITFRTVQRHISGTSIPYGRHISGYQRVFSKCLKRQVTIKKMS